jgi:cellulose synthase operon protein B
VVKHIFKYMSSSVLLLCLLAVLGTMPITALAHPATQIEEDTPESETPASDIYTFAEIGLGEQTLVGPFETKRLQFNLPADWQLTEEAFVQLDLNVTILRTGAAAEAVAGDVGGVLRVSFNGQRIGIFTVTDDPTRSLEIPIPEAALAGNSGRHELTVTLDTQRECGDGVQVNMTVLDTSVFGLPHESVALTRDLSFLPRPFYQRTFLPESALLVVPDQPTAAEIQSALTVAAGFGRMSGNRFGLNLRRSSELDADEYETNHLILVGKPGTIPLLDELTLPIEATDTAFALEEMQADDGILQIANSPWNTGKLALIVSGNSDNGVIKASKALAAQQILTNAEDPSFSIIAEVNDLSQQTIQPDTQSFADLGYDTRGIDLPGITTLSYDFQLPQGYAPDDEVSTEIFFTHSTLLDYDQSGLVVLINGDEIGGTRFSDTSTSLTSVRLTIPRSGLQLGRNTLTLRVTLQPTVNCFDREALDLWFTAWPESSIYLPLGPAPEQVLQSRGLDTYPQPFSSSPTLNTTAFIISNDDTSSWQTAFDIASELGSQANSQFIDLLAAYSNDVSEELRENRDLLIVGRPSKSPLLAEINDSLPAPFASGSDQAISRITQITFRTEGESVGYLQLLSAPWNEQRTILAVLGSSDEGIAWAGQALINGDLRARLGGSFALVVNEQIFIAGTRLSTPVQEPSPPDQGATGVITSTNPISPSERPVTNYPDARPPSDGPPLLLPLLLSIGAMVLVVGGIAGFMWTRQNGPIRLPFRKPTTTTTDTPTREPFSRRKPTTGKAKDTRKE